MLVVTANWGFTDGTLVVAKPRLRAAREWLREIKTALVRSGFGRDGRYRPPADVDIVLAGDTFDCLTSTAWCGRERPWHAGERARDARQRVILACARRATPLLAGLARFVRTGLAAPAADRRGRPAEGAFVRVPVRVTLLAGDRDRHVAEAAAAVAIRDATVAPAWSDGTVLVRHGHEFDPACHAELRSADDERAPTLAESVAVDLVTGFMASLVTRSLPRRAVTPLIDMLAGTGPADIPAVIGSWTAGDGPGAALDATVRRDVVAVWHQAVDAWLRAARRTPPDCGLPASPLEDLASWFVGTERQPPTTLDGLFDRRLPPAAGPAGGAKAVVMGHPTPSAGDAATVCLGRPASRRWGPVTVVREGLATDVACVVAAPAAIGPATVVCRRDGDRLTWRSMGAAGALGAEAAVDAAAVVDAA